MAAVRELEPEYEGRIVFEIIPPEETLKRAEELQEFDLGSHGMVIFDADGVDRAHIPGHEFGRPEIEVAIQTVLVSTP